MLDLILRLVINAIALVAAVTLVPRVRLDVGDDWWKLLAIAALFGVINTFIRPIVSALSLPLNLIALGLVGFIVNAVMLLLLAFLSSQLDLGLTFAGWPGAEFGVDVIVAAVLAAIVISVVSTILGLVRRIVPG